jgi:hypothetical protein
MARHYKTPPITIRRRMVYRVIGGVGVKLPTHLYLAPRLSMRAGILLLSHTFSLRDVQLITGYVFKLGTFTWNGAPLLEVTSISQILCSFFLVMSHGKQKSKLVGSKERKLRYNLRTGSTGMNCGPVQTEYSSQQPKNKGFWTEFIKPTFLLHILVKIQIMQPEVPSHPRSLQILEF